MSTSMLDEMNRPQGDQYFVDRGSEMVASALAPQLGTDVLSLQSGEFDMRRLTVITEDIIPLLLYCGIKARKFRVWGFIHNQLLNYFVSVGGRGRRDIIRMEAVSKGGMPNVESEIPSKPGPLARNLWDRGWRERNKQEGL